MNKKDVEKLLEKPILCTDGNSHYMDESHQHYLLGQIVAALRDESQVHNPVTGNDYPLKARQQGNEVKSLWDKPQVDEEGLLTDEQLKPLLMNFGSHHDEDIKVLLKSQLSADNARWQKRMEGLVKEIDGMLGREHRWWQSLKSHIRGE